MAKKRKKTRKELLKEPDEFITISSKLIGFVIEHKIRLIYALGVLIALVVIISGVRFFSIRAENKAAALLDKSLANYSSIKEDNKPDEVYDRMSADFQFILKKYGGQESGKIAGLIYANICYNDEKYKQATNLYKKALTDFEKYPMIQNQILSNLGYTYEQLKDYPTAVSYFEKIASASELIMRAEALYHLGWLYDKLGQKEKSKAAYNKIISDHQEFIYIDLVKEQISG